MRTTIALREAAESSLRRGASTTHTNAFISRASPEHVKEQESQYLSSPHSSSSLKGKRIAIKDNICTHGFPTTCGSKGLSSFNSPFDATVVARLRAAGATISGKTNLDEFGMGSHSLNSHYGPVQNSQAGYSAGGSSGGSAVAVASGECDAALGTDTGGSVRLPAAFNGVYGFKPSYGLVSRWGVVPYANSLDTVGFLSSDLSTLSQIFEASRAFDTRDPTSVRPATLERLRHLLSQREVSDKMTVGVPKEYNIAEMSPVVRDVWVKVLRSLQQRGHHIQLVSLPMTRQALSSYYVLAPAEASSNLAKYDNVRYGNKEDIANSSSSVLYASARKHGFGDEVRRRILLGSYSLSAEAMDNYFIQAQKIRRLMMLDFDDVFSLPNIMAYQGREEVDASSVDCILCPTAHTLVPSIEDVQQQSPLESYASDTFCVPASLAGIPAMTIPFTAQVQDTGPQERPLHVGMQVLTQYGDDARAFEISRIVESCRDEVESG